MFDLGMSELLVIGVVALIVIGPKDLPGLFQSLGRMTAKVRAMGREFSRAMETAANEAGVKDVAKDLKDATSSKAMGLDKVKAAADKFEKWDPMKSSTPSKPAAPKSPAPGASAAAEPVAEEKPMGPMTAALAEKQAARKAAAAEAAEKLRTANSPAPEAQNPTTPGADG